MTGDVDDRDAGLVLTALQVLGDLVPPFFSSPGNSRLQIEAVLEVDVGDVVAADRAVELQRAAPHVDAVQARDVARQRHQVFGDALKVIELASKALQLFVCVCRGHEKCAGSLKHTAGQPSARLACVS